MGVCHFKPLLSNISTTSGRTGIISPFGIKANGWSFLDFIVKFQWILNDVGVNFLFQLQNQFTLIDTPFPSLGGLELMPKYLWRSFFENQSFFRSYFSHRGSCPGVMLQLTSLPKDETRNKTESSSILISLLYCSIEFNTNRVFV